ncbi:ABC transporter substrate-binding protein [Bacillus sp. Marseille-P3661]|uniref:ABC transporter substrate-binding protein n=1 Tax=Bacillus sp. Marseille-P3661 TaxID=1936234 RepID=UPI000C85879A|nr:extracellular solute-binding protein [Bacillus sp. Marseille-P3661]
MNAFKGKFRLISLCVVVSLLLSILAACGGSETSSDAKPSNEGETPKAEEKKGPTTLEDFALYEGADRHDLLVEAAKKEGELMVYTSAPMPDAQKLGAAFEEKYGIKVNIWRAGSEDVLHRIISEAKAGKHTFDVVDTNGGELEALHREGALQKVNSPYQADLIPEAVPEHKEWIGNRINIFTQAYNTNLLTEEELPKTWEDLLDPKWKGKVSIEAGDLDWFAGLIGELGEDKIQLFKDIVATNDVTVRNGHTLLTELVASGEVPLALTIYNYKAESMNKDGAPVQWFYIGEKAIARPNGIGVSGFAPHPAAAVLYYDFMINEAQEMLLEMDFVPTSTKAETNLNDMPMEFIDPAVILDEHAKWKDLYEEIFINKK